MKNKIKPLISLLIIGALGIASCSPPLNEGDTRVSSYLLPDKGCIRLHDYGLRSSFICLDGSNLEKKGNFEGDDYNIFISPDAQEAFTYYPRDDGKLMECWHTIKEELPVFDQYRFTTDENGRSVEVTETVPGASITESCIVTNENGNFPDEYQPLPSQFRK